MILWLFIIFPSWTYADFQQEFAQGQIFYEAKQYRRAEEHFFNALQESAAPWQRAVIHYNLGTVNLRQKNWDQAILQFQQAKKQPNIPPYLIAPLEMNLAIALLERLHSLLEIPHPSDKPTSKAEQKGWDVIFHSPFFSASRLTNPHSLLNLITQAVSNAQKGLCAFVDMQGGGTCENHPVIIALKEIIQKQTPLVREKENEFQQQWNHLSESSPFSRQLHELIDQLSPLLVSENLSGADFSHIEQQFSQSESLNESNIISSKIIASKQKVHTAKLIFAQAKKNIEEKNFVIAHIFLLETVQLLQQELMTYVQFEKGDLFDPKILLRYAIKVQQDALDLSTETEDTVDTSLPLAPVLLTSQKNAWQAGEAFGEAVYQWQKTHYRPENKSSCQKEPWATLMPFYHLGLQKGYETLKVLALTPPVLPYVIELQKKTLYFWNRALDFLQLPPTPEQEIKKTPTPIEFEQVPRTTEQLIQTIIELEEQDSPQRVLERKRKEMEKPW